MPPIQQMKQSPMLQRAWAISDSQIRTSYGTVNLFAQFMRHRGIDIGWNEYGPIIGKSSLLYMPTLIAALLSAPSDSETDFDNEVRSFYSPPGCAFGWCGTRNLLESVGSDLNVLHAFGERPYHPQPVVEARLRKVISSEWGSPLSEIGMKGYRLVLLMTEELRDGVEELTRTV